jgi:hypothetical protein
MAKNRLIVIGEGPAGLMAAGQAAQAGAEVLLLAKMDRPGYKLRLTGNGRCNLTNTDPLPEFIRHFSPDGRFLRQAFSQFFSSELTNFFEKLGVTTTIEQNRFIFPAAGKAADVVNALTQWVSDCGVNLQMLCPAEKLFVENSQITGVQASQKNHTKLTFPADAVIIATGGASYPSTGSTGDGYKLAESVGHTIVPVRPALIPLETAGDVAPRLQGLSLDNVKITVLANEKKITQKCGLPRCSEAKTGEILFTHFGVSGPAILSLSGQIVDQLRLSNKVTISIDLTPDLNEHQLDNHLVGLFAEHGKKQLKTIISNFVPAKLALACADLIKLSPDKVGSQISADGRRKLKCLLKDFRLYITASRPLAEAMVTAGGVSTNEVDPRSMASRLVKGLYFAGEVLDIDGDTGGYNLQAAFSTGFLAARSAANL